MHRFRYKAVDQSGVEMVDIIEAERLDIATSKIQEKGLFLLNISPEKKTFSDLLKIFLKNCKKNSFLQVQSISLKDLSSLTRKLATLLSAGLPILRCLRVLREQKQSYYLSSILRGLEEDISAGESFSNALCRYPSVFNRLYVSMIRAGEAGGVMSLVLGRLADFFEQNYVFRKKVKHSMVYPAIIVCVAVVVVMILMLFVIPKFKLIFIELNVELPAPTLFLLGLSSFLKKYILWFILVLGGGALCVRAALMIAYIHSLWDYVRLKLPFWGGLLQKIEIVRFSRLLGTLLQNGVPILQSFDIVLTASTNDVYRQSIAKVQEHIREGEGLSVPMKECSVFPSLMVNMVEVGEESGHLDDMLIKVAVIYEEDVKNMVDTITKMIEPLLIVVLSIGIGFIIVAMFLPLVTMMNALGR